jgi:uncharacterized repeat protein (TIGR03847 family)
MPEPIMVELKPTTFLTVGTVGPPGRRTFYLQGSRGSEIVSLILEKEQARALALALNRLLNHIVEIRGPVYDQTPVSRDLLQPVEPLFRVGQMGLGYDEDNDLIVIHAQELVSDPDETPPGYVRFWVDRSQVRPFCESTMRIVESGRPICSLCGEPIDPDGHFCPPGNGHEKPWLRD